MCCNILIPIRYLEASSYVLYNDTVNKLVSLKKEAGEHPLDNKREEAFCALFATNEEFFGNGVQSFIRAFNFDMSEQNAYDKAKNRAARLLAKRHILERVNHFLVLLDLNPAHVDKQLAFVLTQNANLAAKMDAVKVSLKMQGRLNESNNTLVINNMSDAALDSDIVRLQKEIKEGEAACSNQEEQAPASG